MQYTPYLWPLWISAVVLMLLAVYTLLHRERSVSPRFFIVVATLFVWVVGFAFEVAGVDLQTKLFWANVQFSGIAALPVAWLTMVLDYTGQLYRWKRRLVVLAVVPVITNIIIWTNPLHHWFRGQPWLNTHAPFPILVNDYGPWFFWVHFPFGIILFLVSFVLLIRSLNFRIGVYRKQSLLLILSTILPLAVDTLYAAGISPIPNFNFTPVVFSFSGLLIGWSLLFFGFLDLMPTARSVLVETMADAWLVLDDKARLVDLNPAASRLINTPAKRVIGRTARAALRQQPALIKIATSAGEMQTEIRLPGAETDQFYELRVSLLCNRRGQFAGRLMTLHNMTARKRAE